MHDVVDDRFCMTAGALGAKHRFSHRYGGPSPIAPLAARSSCSRPSRATAQINVGSSPQARASSKAESFHDSPSCEATYLQDPCTTRCFSGTRTGHPRRSHYGNPGSCGSNHPAINVKCLSKGFPIELTRQRFTCCQHSRLYQTGWTACCRASPASASIPSINAQHSCSTSIGR